MNRIYHGEELRAASLDCPPPDYLPAKESGSLFYAQYNQLLQDNKPHDARQLGLRALERVWWARGYPVSDIVLEDQFDIATFDDPTIEKLLIRQSEIVQDITEEFNTILPELYDQLGLRLNTAIEKGYIAADVRKRLDNVREQTVWIVSDGMGDTLGMASTVDRTALISSDLFLEGVGASYKQTRIEEVFTHEMLHRLTGVSATGEYGPVYRRGLEPMSKKFKDAWLNEAVTERIAWHLMHDDWHIKQQWVDTKNYTYIDESLQLRILLKALPFKVLTDYYFDESEDGQTKKELHKALRETLGVTYSQFIKATDAMSRTERYEYIKNLTSTFSDKRI